MIFKNLKEHTKSSENRSKLLNEIKYGYPK